MHKFLILAGGAALAACGSSEQADPSGQESPAQNSPLAPRTGGEKGPGALTANTAAANPGASPCLVQDGTALSIRPLRAVGTEPFWGARIEGRCVTYLTPEDQAGTRIWTKFSGTAEQGSWTGSLDGRRFELRTSPDPRCSDGMSDTVYPIEVTLFVRDEERRGCAEPLAAGNRQ